MSMRIKHHSLQQAGDSIVEVLIAIAIVSLVLAGAYISSNKNVAETQDTQEHSQALEIVQGQAELLHEQGSIDTAHNICFDPSTGNPVPSPPPTPNPCVFAPNGPNTQPRYSLTITGGVGATAYGISAVWPSITGSGNNNVTIYYRP
jgi:type II secretory pathway pseudopilin PulG